MTGFFIGAASEYRKDKKDIDNIARMPELSKIGASFIMSSISAVSNFGLEGILGNPKTIQPELIPFDTLAFYIGIKLGQYTERATRYGYNRLKNIRQTPFSF